MGWGGWGKGWGWGYGKGKGKGKGSLRVAPEMKVWVGGLASTVQWKDLQAHVDAQVKSKWVEVFTGKSAGTGAVVFGSAEDATKAVAALNGTELSGQAIQVDVWVKKPKEDAPAPEEVPPASQTL
mmetsp:Transcript_159874/g.282012  ORF Transcript_159874/g.282012 Transcript_159874/m.282012 type:complete len:125 (+) Transcript_159874:98-472(+)